MKIKISVKPNSRITGVKKLPDGTYRVSVSAPPREGRANEELIEALADFFGVRKSDVRILLGTSGKKKLVEIQ